MDWSVGFSEGVKPLYLGRKKVSRVDNALHFAQGSAQRDAYTLALPPVAFGVLRDLPKSDEKILG